MCACCKLLMSLNIWLCLQHLNVTVAEFCILVLSLSTVVEPRICLVEFQMMYSMLIMQSVCDN